MNMPLLSENIVEVAALACLVHVPNIAATLRSDAMSGCNRTIQPTSIEDDVLCIS